MITASPVPPLRPLPNGGNSWCVASLPGASPIHLRLITKGPCPSFQVCRQSGEGVAVYPFGRSVNG